MNNYETDDPSETSEILSDHFAKIGESITKKAKAMNSNVDFKTFLNNFVSQSIMLELPQPIEIFNISNSRQKSDRL